MRAIILGLLVLASAAPAVAQNWDCGIYRQDRSNATGWMMRTPDTDAERATVRFSPTTNEAEITDTDGVTKAYYSIGGGTGLRTRALIENGKTGDDGYWYSFYTLHSFQPGEPDHFLILQGDLYWPECP